MLRNWTEIRRRQPPTDTDECLAACPQSARASPTCASATDLFVLANFARTAAHNHQPRASDVPNSSRASIAKRRPLRSKLPNAQKHSSNSLAVHPSSSRSESGEKSCRFAERSDIDRIRNDRDFSAPLVPDKPSAIHRRALRKEQRLFAPPESHFSVNDPRYESDSAHPPQRTAANIGAVITQENSMAEVCIRNLAERENTLRRRSETLADCPT